MDKPLDPRIPKIKRLLEMNPKLNMAFFKNNFSVGVTTLKKWHAQGLIPLPYTTPKHEMGPKWRRDGAGWLSPKKYQRNLLTQKDERIKDESRGS